MALTYLQQQGKAGTLDQIDASISCSRASRKVVRGALGGSDPQEVLVRFKNPRSFTRGGSG